MREAPAAPGSRTAAPASPNNSSVTVEPAVKSIKISLEKLDRLRSGDTVDAVLGAPFISSLVLKAKAAVVLT